MVTLSGCSRGFKTNEKAIINAGEGEIMRVLTIGDRADSLVLRSKAVPMTAEGVFREGIRGGAAVGKRRGQG